MIKRIVYISFWLAWSGSLFGQSLELQFVEASSNMPIQAAVWIDNQSVYLESDVDGKLDIDLQGLDTLWVTTFAEGYGSRKLTLTMDIPTPLTIPLNPLQLTLDDYVVQGQDEQLLVDKLSNVRGMGIYAGKKTELLLFKNFKGNQATNNAREMFASVPGLNIWENDASGLQLNIGARGLDPNRTAHFNTRQNGYDISADALGYPESYYTPPVQALAQIELVRGAASLQFGPQFGGMLNFVLKEETQKPFSFESIQSVSSNAQFSTYNAIGGKKGPWTYYGYGFYKRGDGYRPNASFEQVNAYGKLAYSKGRSKLSVEHTFMNYLAQLPGGLVDFEFDQDPFTSKRFRNWFNVNWNLSAIRVDHAFSASSRMQFRGFMLNARRQSVGELGPINRPDPGQERDLIKGFYHNLGAEFRYLKQYNFKGSLNTFLVGARAYQGNTQNQQGFAAADSTASFVFLNPTEPQISDYSFPGSNQAVFAEHIFNFNDRFFVSPGMRLEHLVTRSEGYYYYRVFAGNQLLIEEQVQVDMERPRLFPLFGLGLAYKLGEDKRQEIYANGSQNFRSINFSDISVSNPNLIVDQDLSDEQGYNLELGYRGKHPNGRYRFDANVFFLSYQNRIGLSTLVNPDLTISTYRTNIGDARVVGLESFQQYNFKPIQLGKETFKWLVFANCSYQQGTYVKASPDIEGNQLEKIPPFSLRTGVNLQWGNWGMNFLYSYIAEQFTDATNAIFVADATRGIIPAYQVGDCSLSWKKDKLGCTLGVNNIWNEIYFTQRAVSYPGPGIMTAAPRILHVSFSLKL